MTAWNKERALVAADPRLPGLGLLLDESRLLAALRKLPLFTSARALRTRYLRYKHATSCVLALEIDTGDEQPLCWVARALTVERFAVSWQHPKRQALVATNDPQAPMAIQEQAIILEHPCQDRGLRHLRFLWDAQSRLRLLQRWLPTQAERETIHCRFLRYKPGRRCVAGLYCGEVPLAIVRCASAKDYGTILQGCATGAALGHIDILGLEGRYRMAATRWLPGESLDQLLTHASMPVWVEDAGKALAEIHDAPFTLPLRRSQQDDMCQVRREQESLATIDPQAQARFSRCLLQLEAYLDRFSTTSVVLHGDFSADQVVIAQDGRLRIIDWDRSTCGHPLNDLGSFIARLEMDVIEEQLTRERADIARRALLKGYTSARSLALDGLLWYTVRALLSLATEPFRKRSRRWPQIVDALLTRAEQLCDDALRNYASTDWQHRMIQLTSPDVMEAPLKQALGLAPQARLREACVLRQKPGRRALIAWRFATGTESNRKIVGKYRAKGLDHKAFACQQALWRDGFHAQARFSVPEPLAVLDAQHIWLQRHVDGVTLAELLLKKPPPGVLADTGSAAGLALAALQHSTALRQAVGNRHWAFSDELQVLSEGFEHVASRYPNWRSRLSSLFAACARLSSPLAMARQSVLHRDFYPEQVLVSPSDARHLTLLDFDLCSYGAAALDAGNYLAHVSELALRQYADIGAFGVHEKAFLRAYLNTSPQVTSAEVQAYRALSLARHIFLSTRFTARTHTTQALLIYCEKLMESFS
jgi:aminoglycoside phosphotransferase (APT) family kinase protein